MNMSAFSAPRTTQPCPRLDDRALLANLLVCLAAMAWSPCGLAQPRPVATMASPATDSEVAGVVQGLLAQYQVTLVRERRLADDRELRLISDAEARMRRARFAADQARAQVVQVSQQLGATQAELRAARAEYASLASTATQRDTRARAEIAAYRAEVQVLAQRASPDKLDALTRFADGDRVGAWPVIKQITDAARQARDAATAKANAADQRELAKLRNIMRENGEATTQDVLALWDEAAAADPQDFWTHFWRARLAIEIGQLSRAAKALEQAQPLATSDNERAVVLSNMADIADEQGDLVGARQGYEQALLIDERLVRASPDAPELASQLSTALNKLGHVQMTQGDLNGARRRFERSLSIRQQLSQSNAGSGQLQRDVSVSHENLGDVFARLGDRDAARRHFESSLNLREALVRANPASLELQRDGAVALNKLGDLLVAQGALAEALSRYESSLRISMRLSQLDRSSAKFQRDVASGLFRVGDVFRAQGEMPAARQRLEDSLAIYEQLFRTDPTSEFLQKAMAVCHERLGMVRFAQGDRPGALAQQERSLLIRQRLAQANPASAELQRDVMSGLAQRAGLTRSRRDWQRVVDALLAMKDRKILDPSDNRLIEIAQQQASGAELP